MSLTLQEHRLTGTRGSEDNAALALADRCEQIHDARAELVFFPFQIEFLVRVDRGEVFERYAALRPFGGVEVHGVDAHQGEILFLVSRLADLSRDGVAHLQVEAANPVLADVDVVRAGLVVVVGIAEESVAFGHDFEDAFSVDRSVFAVGCAEDAVNQRLLTHLLEIGDVQFHCLALEFEHRETAQFLPLGAGGGHLLGVGGRQLHGIVENVVLRQEAVAAVLELVELVEFVELVVAVVPVVAIIVVELLALLVAVLVLRVGVLLAVFAGLCLGTFGCRCCTFLAGGLLFVCLYSEFAGLAAFCGFDAVDGFVARGFGARGFKDGFEGGLCHTFCLRTGGAGLLCDLRCFGFGGFFLCVCGRLGFASAALGLLGGFAFGLGCSF